MPETTWSESLAQADWAEERDPLSVSHAFEQITDGRHARGGRSSVALGLTLLGLGKGTGMPPLTALAEWVRWRAEWRRQVLPGAGEPVPCVATWSHVVRAGEAEQVIPVLASWLRRLEAARRCGAEPRRWLAQPAAQEPPLQVALDGKPLRGPLAHAAPDQGSQQVVALYETQTGIVLAQQAVPDTGNEIPLEAVLPHAMRNEVVASP